MNDKEIPVLSNQPTPPPFEFPWREMRDFIAVFSNRLAAERDVAVGEAMLKAKHPDATEEQVANVRRKVAEMEQLERILNHNIEQRLIAIEGNGPRIVIPRGGH
jgi:hypothetical protein